MRVRLVGMNKDSLEFRYIKSPAFHTVHVDGAHGGLTPRGLIHMATFNERPAIPNAVAHEVDAGLLGAEVSRRGYDDLVRELDVNLVFDINTAEVLIAWLTDQVAKLREALAKEAANVPAK